MLMLGVSKEQNVALEIFGTFIVLLTDVSALTQRKSDGEAN